MKRKLITHNDQGKELPNPTIKDFGIDDELCFTTYDNEYLKKNTCFKIIQDHSGNKTIITKHAKDIVSFVDLKMCYPILRPITELKEVVKVGSIDSFPFTQDEKLYIRQNEYSKEGIFNAYIGLIYYNKSQLRWLRDNQFCTADFKFDGEVKHAQINK